MVVTGPVDLRPDPRISNYPPDWLSKRQDWSDLLEVMSDEDVDWLTKQWDMAVDRSEVA